MEQSNEYNPIGCEHKLSNGLTAWQFQSEEQNNLNGGLNKVAIYVCINCGEISVGGYRTGADGSHNSFDEHFNIHCPDAIDAIIKQANFFNEEAKWCRADDYALVKAKCERYEGALKLIEQMSDPGDYYKAIVDLKAYASKALSAGEGDKEETPDNPGTTEAIFIKYNETGECRIDIAKTINLWDANWFISQWHDQYTIVKGNKEVKARISKRQAKELIVELDLMPEQSPIFRNGKTWKNQKEDKQ